VDEDRDRRVAVDFYCAAEADLETSGNAAVGAAGAKRRTGEYTPDPVGRKSRRAEDTVLLPDLSTPCRADGFAQDVVDSNAGFTRMLGDAISTERLKSGAGSTFGDSSP
jgi:hypothetical protein